MRILVTGAAGFIGSHVCERLVDDGHDVVGIDDLSTGSVDNLEGIGVQLVQGSILDHDALAEATTGAGAIVHLAARPSVPRSIIDPVASHEANATGTLRVLEAARVLDNPIVVVASSSSVYGANPTLPKREDLACQPLSPYAVSKLATEQYALAWQHSYGLRTLAFRFFNVFGPRQAPGHAYAAVIPAFTHAAITGAPLTVHGDGTQSRDFTYVGTVTGVIVDAITRGVTCATPVNLAFGSRTSLLEVIERLGSITGLGLLPCEHTEVRAGDVPHSQADNTLLRSLFPDVEPVPLDDGLRATVDWMKDYSAAADSNRGE
jgi:UDP-glucose 4-epimerase